MLTRWNLDLPPIHYIGPVEPWAQHPPTCPTHEVGSAFFQETLNALIHEPYKAIDTETTDLDKIKAMPLYLSVAWGGKDQPHSKRVVLHASAIPALYDAFQTDKGVWWLANAKFDMHMLSNAGAGDSSVRGCVFKAPVYDVQVAHALIYDDMFHRLKFIAKHLLEWTWADFEDQFGKLDVLLSEERVRLLHQARSLGAPMLPPSTQRKARGEDNIRLAELMNYDLLIQYAGNDAWGTLRCGEVLEQQLKRSVAYSLLNDAPPYIRTQWDLFVKSEVPYTKTLWRNERRGALVDLERLNAALPQAKTEIDELSRKINKEAGTVVNVNSAPQLRKLFFEQRQHKPLKKTKGGKTGVRSPSCDKTFLEYAAEVDPLAEMILRHRELTKLRSTYLVGLTDKVDAFGRIHTNYKQTGAKTGRISSEGPNLQ